MIDLFVQDKGLVAIAGVLPSFKKGLLSLNLSDCKASVKGTTALLTAIIQHEKSCSTLKSLQIGGNKLDTEGSKLLSQLISKALNLDTLGIASSNVDCFNLTGKKFENISTLDFSGNKIITKDSKHLDVARFFQVCPNLKRLNLSRTMIVPEIVHGKQFDSHSPPH